MTTRNRVVHNAGRVSRWGNCRECSVSNSVCDGNCLVVDSSVLSLVVIVVAWLYAKVVVVAVFPRQQRRTETS